MAAVLPEISTVRTSGPTICQLANGLTIVAEQMPVDAVSLNVWLQVGSSVETDATNGMAHFLEHMTFKGTANLAPGEFDRRVEARGAVMNAATSQDYTHYFITTAPQDFAELAPLQLELVAQSRIPADEFERERAVVLEEIRRSQDSPARRLHAHMMSACFEHLPYRRPVLGSHETVGALTPAQMRDFHRNWYQPQNMTVAAVGNLPVETLIETICDRLPAIESSPTNSPVAPAPAPIAAEDAFTAPIRHEYNDPGVQQARLVLLWRVPGLTKLAQTYALDAIAAILGQGRMSRLFRELREERQWVNSVSASNATQKLQGYFYISARLPEENIERVEAAIRGQLRCLQQEPVTASELTRIRTQVANRFIFANERPGDRTNLYGYYLSQVGDLSAALDYPQQVQALQAENLQAAVQRYLSPDICATVVVRPQG
ncbi:MAG: pitrilysin family protein [Cyanobacteria bacterium J06641_5]